MKLNLIGGINREQVEQMTKVVAGAGKLSRCPGTVSDVLETCGSYEKNVSFIKRVIGIGHESITDHDYLVFGLEDVSPVVEQVLIQERFSSFTIKSRREVDFRNVGYVIPNFKNEDGELLENQEQLKEMYINHMNSLFECYGNLVDLGVKVEDARFILPYCYHSNIIMGFDAHVVKNLIVRFTKGKESKIDELRELGERLLEIVKERASYLLDSIDKAEINQGIREKIDEKIETPDYEILDGVKLINYTKNIDRTIFTSALMQTYKISSSDALKIYKQVISKDDKYQTELMKTIGLDFDRLPLTQVNFQFQVPISYAVLTHITRHRTHDILVPDFVPIGNLRYYKIPPKAEKQFKGYFSLIFERNVQVYEELRNMGVRQEDLIYFHLSGNMVNIVTNMDGKTLAWILRLRRCNKAQWEIRGIADQMQQLVSEVSHYYPQILGPDCEVKGICLEGKESCGKVKHLQKKQMTENN